jgi:hypothetical protein
MYTCLLHATLATEFVSKLPDKKFSSAAVQGFLLTKTDPIEGVRNIPRLDKRKQELSGTYEAMNGGRTRRGWVQTRAAQSPATMS